MILLPSSSEIKHSWGGRRFFRTPASPPPSLCSHLLVLPPLPRGRLSLAASTNPTPSTFQLQLSVSVEAGVRTAMVQGEEVVSSRGAWLGLADVPTVKCLSLLAKYSCLLCWNSREKSSVEEEIKEKEEAIRQRTDEVQVCSVCDFTCFQGSTAER